MNRQANGIPASFSYAGILRDQAGFGFALENCSNGQQALDLAKERGSKLCRYELV